MNKKCDWRAVYSRLPVIVPEMELIERNGKYTSRLGIGGREPQRKNLYKTAVFLNDDGILFTEYGESPITLLDYLIEYHSAVDYAEAYNIIDGDTLKQHRAVLSPVIDKKVVTEVKTFKTPKNALKGIHGKIKERLENRAIYYRNEWELLENVYTIKEELQLQWQAPNDERAGIYVIRDGYKGWNKGQGAIQTNSKGGAVRLTRDHKIVGICEGFEDAMVLNWVLGWWMQERGATHEAILAHRKFHGLDITAPAFPVWCTLGQGGMKNFKKPEGVETVVYFPDMKLSKNADGEVVGVENEKWMNDKDKKGTEIAVSVPQISGMFCKDWNEWLEATLSQKLSQQ